MAPGIGDMMRGLLGGGGKGNAPGAPAGKPVDYEGFRLQAAPRNRGGQWQVAGVIGKEIDGVLRTHEFIRADMYGNKDDAAEVSLQKAKRLVDERGEGLFEVA